MDLFIGLALVTTGLILCFTGFSIVVPVLESLPELLTNKRTKKAYLKKSKN